MAPRTPEQLRTRARIERLIRLARPALDLVLAAGERLSRCVESDDPDYLPPRPLAEDSRVRARAHRRAASAPPR